MWSRQFQLLKPPCQSIYSMFSQVRFKRFRLCKAVPMELSCSENSIQLHWEILFSFLGSFFPALSVLCSAGDWLCGDKPLSHTVLTQHRVQCFGHMSLFYLMHGLGCWPQTFLFGEFTYSYFLQGKKVFPLLSGFGGFGFGKEVFFFFPYLSNTSSFGKNYSVSCVSFWGVFSVYLSLLMVVV